MHFLFTCSDTFAVATVHSVIQTDGQTDRPTTFSCQ